MSSRLEQVVAAVQSKVDTARTTQSLTAVTWFFGHRHLPRNEGLPRVVWHRTRDQLQPPDNTAPTRTRRTRVAGVVAHIFGSTDEDVECLLDQIISACDEYATSSAEFDQVDWDLPDWLTKGEHCALYITFEQPVQGLTETTTAVITDVGGDNTGTVAGDGILNCGEPT